MSPAERDRPVRAAELGGDLRQALVVVAAEHQPGALARQLLGAGAADTVPGSRHDVHPVGQAEVHDRSPRFPRRGPRAGVHGFARPEHRRGSPRHEGTSPAALSGAAGTREAAYRVGMSPAVVAEVAAWIREAGAITVLTGAGMSTQSGIPDFRGPDGLWTRDPGARRLFDIDAYRTDPQIRGQAWRRRTEHPAWTARPHRRARRTGRLNVPAGSGR